MWYVNLYENKTIRRLKNQHKHLIIHVKYIYTQGMGLTGIFNNRLNTYYLGL